MGHSRGEGTPSELMDGLLARAQNGFEIGEAVLAQARSALMHQSELRSCRQCNERCGQLGYSTFRHVFLLPDGSSLLLWELEHNTGEGGRPLYELYADEDALTLAERRVHERLGGARWEELGGLPLWLPDQLLHTADRWRPPARMWPTTRPTTPVASCAARRTPTARARRPSGCWPPRSPMTSPSRPSPGAARRSRRDLVPLL